MSNIKFHNCDCMDFMRNVPDKQYALAIVDPPYGGGGHDGNITRTGGAWSKKYQRDNSIVEWDYAPTEEYFKELFRISVNQIIWGGNYFRLPPARCFIVWDKMNISEKFSMAMCEYAWTSFNANAKIIRLVPQGLKNDTRFHPTQKPVKLYEKIIAMFASNGDLLLDTHGGSGSSAIAAFNLGFDMDICEISKHYFDLAKKRFDSATRQLTLF